MTPIHKRKQAILLAAGAAACGIAGVIFLFVAYDPSVWLSFVVNENTKPVLFVILMSVLPVLGFPISIFLVLAGVKFGIALGVLVAAMTMPVHLILSFLVAHSLFRRNLERILKRGGYRLPRVEKDRALPFTLFFAAVPGPPYAVKNYFLAMSGIPFRYYMAVNGPVQLAIFVPFIGLGGSAAGMNFWLASAFALLLLGIYFLVRRLKRKYGPGDL